MSHGAGCVSASREQSVRENREFSGNSLVLEQKLQYAVVAVSLNLGLMDNYSTVIV